MPRVMISGLRCLLSALLFTAAAGAQREPRLGERALVPKQVLAAKTALVGNGGGQSYGADSYFDLTRYDGGPNRVYRSFYQAVSDWNHYKIVDSTSEADILLIVRFTNPVVGRDNSSTTDDAPHQWIYDPQLNLSIDDPRSGQPLWTLTEHIEPGSSRAEDNRHFDESITRLADDLKTLVSNPEALAQTENALPPGAIQVKIRRQQAKHVVIGSIVIGVAGGLLASRTARYACPADPPLSLQPDPPFPIGLPVVAPPPPPSDNFQCVMRREQRRMLNEVIGSLGGAIIGGLIGRIWPVSF